MTFKDGVPGWVAAGYPLDNSKALPDCKIPTINALDLKILLDGVLVLDIRNELEVDKMGKFPKSIHIPFEYLDVRYSEVPKGRPIVVVDFSGVEFTCAGKFLKYKGYNQVKGLQGGVKDWIKQGNSLIK